VIVLVENLGSSSSKFAPVGAGHVEVFAHLLERSERGEST
jgi:hypothetical protein